MEEKITELIASLEANHRSIFDEIEGVWDKPLTKTETNDLCTWITNGLDALNDNIGKIKAAASSVDNKAIGIVKDLAEWSKKYPRGGIYSIGSQMDKQLIEIEDRAIEYIKELIK